MDLVDRCVAAGTESPRNVSDALVTLAEFADAQYKSVDTYIRSPEFAARRRLLADADADTACLNEVDKKR